MEYHFEVEDYEALITAATKMAAEKMDSWDLNDTAEFEDDEEEYDHNNPNHVAYMCEYIAQYPFYFGANTIEFTDKGGSYEHKLELRGNRGPQTWASIIDVDSEWAEQNDRQTQGSIDWNKYHEDEDYQVVTSYTGGRSPLNELKSIAASIMACRVKANLIEQQRERLEQEGVIEEGPFGPEVSA